jgi:hypothetical protein
METKQHATRRYCCRAGGEQDAAAGGASSWRICCFIMNWEPRQIVAPPEAIAAAFCDRMSFSGDCFCGQQV